jgi:hypothetical protein
MARALHHDLHIPFPGAGGQLAERHKLLDLRDIPRVLDASRAAGVTQAEGHVICSTDFQQLVKVLIERVFLPGELHPGEDQAAPARNQVHPARVLLKAGCGGAVQAAVNGHKVHPVLRMHFKNIQPLTRGDLGQRLVIINDRIVNRHGAKDGWALRHQLAAEGAGISKGAQIHNGLGPHVDGTLYLLHLHVQIQAVPRGAEVDVDLGLERAADAAGRKALMPFVGGYDHLSLCHQLHEPLERHLFLGGDRLHFLRFNSLPCGIHLCCVPHNTFLLTVTRGSKKPYRKNFRYGCNYRHKRRKTTPKIRLFCSNFISLRRHYPYQVLRV